MKISSLFSIQLEICRIVVVVAAFSALYPQLLSAQQASQPPLQQDPGQSGNQDQTQDSGINLQDLLDQNQPPSIQMLDASTSGEDDMPQLGEQPGINRISSNIPLPNTLTRGTGLILSAQTQVGYDSNFLLLPTDVKGNNFDGMQFLVHYDVAFNRFGFLADYTPGFTLYPGYSSLTANTQGYSQSLDYRWSNRTALYWSATGLRLPSYSGIGLPQTLNVGGVSIILSNLANSIANNTEILYNASSTLGGSHAFSERDLVTFNAIGSWTEIKQQSPPPNTVPFGLRDQTLSADIHYQHLLDTRRSLGVEFTELYIRGLEPRGQQTTEVLLLTYQTPILGKTIATLGAGPLYAHASTHPSILLTGTSYAINAGLSRSVRNSQFNVQYQRGYQLGFISGSYISQSVSGGVSTPLTHHLVANGGASFVYSSQPGITPGSPSGAFYQQGYTGRVDYKFNHDNGLYFLYAHSQFSANGPTPGYEAFNRSQYSVGYTYIFSRTNRERQ